MGSQRWQVAFTHDSTHQLCAAEEHQHCVSLVQKKFFFLITVQNGALLSTTTICVYIYIYKAKYCLAEMSLHLIGAKKHYNVNKLIKTAEPNNVVRIQ